MVGFTFLFIKSSFSKILICSDKAFLLILGIIFCICENLNFCIVEAQKEFLTKKHIGKIVLEINSKSRATGTVSGYLGGIHESFHLVNGEKNGSEIVKDSYNNLMFISQYKHGKLNGIKKYFRGSKKVQSTETYKNNKKHGPTKYVTKGNLDSITKLCKW